MLMPPTLGAGRQPRILMRIAHAGLCPAAWGQELSEQGARLRTEGAELMPYARVQGPAPGPTQRRAVAVAASDSSGRFCDQMRRLPDRGRGAARRSS